jgi:hypothetical protein
VSPLTRTLQTAALAFGHEEPPQGNQHTLQREQALMDGVARVDWLDPEGDAGRPSSISSAHNARFVANEVRDVSIELPAPGVFPSATPRAATVRSAL